VADDIDVPGRPARLAYSSQAGLIFVSAGVTETLPEIAIGRSGGQVTSRDGRVALQFSPDAIRIARTISGSVWVRSVPNEEDAQADTAPTLMRLVLGPDGDFSAPVTVSLRLGDLFATADRAGAAVPSLRTLRPTRVTRTVPAEDGTPVERVFREDQIEPVAQRYDPQSGILTATLWHFSNYDVVLTQPQAPEAWKPAPNAASVALFRGAAAAAVPVKAPAAPGAPGLSLQYSSASAEEWTGANVGQSYNGGLAWVVGTGWQMSISRISRTTQQDNCRADGYQEADHYTLVLNGATYSLVSAGGGSYVTKEYSPLRIDLCANTATSCGGVPISTQTSPSGSYCRQIHSSMRSSRTAIGPSIGTGWFG
jgi:hypothetical protein